MSYSVAIRTLGTSGEKFVRELTSISQQTIKPEKVVIYIAEGYDRPPFQIGKEEYVWVKKGMVAQRALPYTEIDSDFILLLDDDVELKPDSVARMLQAMAENCADCVAADTFKNQEMSLKSKVFAIISNWVFPHFDQNYAFKIRSHGSFSYLKRPQKAFYWSQSCAGPCSLWKKKALLAMHFEDELWLDKLGFAFGDDAIESYKLYFNGYKLGVLYDSGVVNLDAKSASSGYHSNINKYYTRSIGSFLIWWRCNYSHLSSFWRKLSVASIYSIKCIWLLFVNLAAALMERNIRVLYLYLKGIKDGVVFIHTHEASSILPYQLKKRNIIS